MSTFNYLPAAELIADAAAAASAQARTEGDASRADRLNRVRMNVLRGAHLVWHAGELLVSSVNTPGAVYAVSEAGCTCPATKPCWHEELVALLIEMADAAEGDTDLESEPEQLDLVDSRRGRALAWVTEQLQRARAALQPAAPVAPAVEPTPAAEAAPVATAPALVPGSHEAAVWVAEQRRAHGRDICGRPAGQSSRPLSMFAQRDAETQRLAQLGEERARIAEQQAARELRQRLAVAARQRMDELFA